MSLTLRRALCGMRGYLKAPDWEGRVLGARTSKAKQRGGGSNQSHQCSCSKRGGMCRWYACGSRSSRAQANCNRGSGWESRGGHTRRDVESTIQEGEDNFDCDLYTEYPYRNRHEPVRSEENDSGEEEVVLVYVDSPTPVDQMSAGDVMCVEIPEQDDDVDDDWVMVNSQSQRKTWVSAVTG